MEYNTLLFLAGRLLFGGFFLMNGLNHFMKFGMMKGYSQSKNVPMPGLAVGITGALLVLGGLGILLGAYVNWAVLAIAVFLVPTTFMMHAFWKAPPEQKMTEQIQFMKNMALLGAAFMMLSIPGPWMYSVL